MNSFINYLVESGISLGALSLVYFAFLRNETFFKANRLFLLFSIVFSSILPLLHLPVWGSQQRLNLDALANGQPTMLETITVTGSGFSGFLAQWISTSNLLVFGYLLGVVVMLALVILRISQILRLVSKHRVVVKNGIKYVSIDEDSSPYSFLDYLFVSKKLEAHSGWEKMLAHESEHIHQGHTVDILVLELISIFQWFNPFFWLLRRIIKENHEYMADQAVLDKGVAINQYKEILITQFIGRQFSIANNFNSSLIKSRIKMMSKIKSSNKAKFRYVAGVMMVAALTVIFACERKDAAVVDEPVESGVQLKSATTAQPLILIDGEEATTEAMEKLDPQNIESVNVLKTDLEDYVCDYGEPAKNGVVIIKLKSAKIGGSDDSKEIVVVGLGTMPDSDGLGDDVYMKADKMPQFPGGDLGLRKFIASGVKYPVVAQENGIEGKVYVTFVIEKDGSVGRARVARGVDTSLDAEALRVINSLPKWTPAEDAGKPVAVSFTVPISFMLQ